MKLRTTTVAITLLLLFSGIASIFWYQELQYARPTPIPAGYQPVAVGDAVQLSKLLKPEGSKPVLLHFFNPECSCSRFNLKHLKELVRKYQSEVTFVTVIPENLAGQTEQIREDLGIGVPVVADRDKQLARKCGVYATPQAALISPDGRLYYRGNYNKSRYCTQKNSNFAQMAIDSLLDNAAAPDFNELATKAYGCELPETSQVDFPEAEVFSGIE